MLFHRFFYCHIGCLVNLSILILTFCQTVVLLFFIDSLIVSHSILIGRSFSADDGLIQYQWAAHSVPFVRAGLMRWALVHCMTDISAGRLIGPWTLLPCGESTGSGRWSWLRSPCDTHRKTRKTRTKIAISPNICINIVNNRGGGVIFVKIFAVNLHMKNKYCGESYDTRHGSHDIYQQKERTTDRRLFVKLWLHYWRAGCHSYACEDMLYTYI